jgi:RNA polymerase sigma-70 factor (ECF subfamily)
MKWRHKVIDEQQLIEGCVHGEPWAQMLVYEQYSEQMMAVCVRYVSDRETARDLLQDAFIKVFTNISSYNGSGSFAGWIRRIFITTSLEYLRKNDALKQSVNLDDFDYSIEHEEVTILDTISANELMKCVEALPNGYRTVFNLYAIEGYAHAEIANMLDISENTSRSQFMRARKLLQKSVQSLIY